MLQVKGFSASVFILSVSFLCALSGCGGGGGSSESAASDIPPSSTGTPTAPLPPTISGEPALVVAANSLYSFVPLASDPNGDALSFSAAGLPSWADFDSATGRLWGTPDQMDTGFYDGIRISVTDGETVVALAEFGVDVVAQAAGFATVTWNPPTESADGSALNDLAGFYVYYGQALGNYPQVVNIQNPSATSYRVENLASGTHYFVVTAYDTDGFESAPSPAASKVIL
jgi:hypothetical protein